MKKGDQNNSADDEILCARVNEALKNADSHSRCSFIGFLDERQAQLVKRKIGNIGNVLYWGGADECERVVLGVFPDWMENDSAQFPIEALTFTFRKESTLSHRDILGSLMGLGIERDTVGDILVGEGRAVIFVRTEVVKYIVTQMTKIGREGVKISSGYEGELPKGAALLPISTTIASPRLDCVVAALINCGRTEAAQRISAGTVSLNFAPCISVSQEVKEKDKLSIRGEGKFLIEQIGPLTRKKRLSFRAGKYQ